MKKLTNLAAFIALIFIFTSSLSAQDADIERLQKITAIIGKVNLIPVNFSRASPELNAAGLANVRKQAGLLKQLPAGTVVEIGVHTYAVGDEPKNVILTQTRAEKIRSALIAAGVAPSGLTARGYGSSKPLTSDPANEKNRRVEYLVTKSGRSVTPAVVKTPVKNVSSGTPKIVAGQGWGRVEIGATRSQVEFILGSPDFFGADTSKPEDSYGTYFQKGAVVVYNTMGLTVKLVRFIGNAALYSNGDSKFKSFQGVPDKGLAWNSSAAQVIAAYGAPSKREAYGAYPSREEILNLYYPGIHFIFKSDKLLQINIEAGPVAVSGPDDNVKWPFSSKPENGK